MSMMDALFTFIFFLLFAAVPVILVFLLLEAKTSKQVEGVAVVNYNARKVAGLVGSLMVLCFLLLLMGLLMDDETHPFVGGAVKFILKLVVVFFHML